MLLKDSFIELKGRERAKIVFDSGTFRELLGPQDYMESPHLEIQDVVPESDDGVIVSRGRINGQESLVISVEGIFLNGGIGEVSGAKFSGALNIALRENKRGNKIVPIIMFDNGEVRLQEANYGLMAVSEIQSAVIALRKYVPVIGVIPGKLGNCGSMAVTAALCSILIMTKHGKYFMNEPAAIEEKVGASEFNSRNKSLIWDTIGGKARYTQGFCDYLADDDIDSIRNTIIKAMASDGNKDLRSRKQEYYLDKINSIDFAQKVDMKQVKNPVSRGRTWFEKLSGKSGTAAVDDSVLSTVASFYEDKVYIISVVPNLNNRFPGAKNGEMGLYEGWTIAERIRGIVEKDKHKPINKKTPIIAVVDVPGQAYGYNEELLGIFQSCASAVDAYATARGEGHPVIALIAGKAVSAAFLSHGYQANRIIAFDDPKVFVHVMEKDDYAKTLKKDTEYLNEIGKKIPGLSYDINCYGKLGSLSNIIDGINVDDPTDVQVEKTKKIIKANIDDIRNSSSADLGAGVGLKSKSLQNGRPVSVEVIKRLEEEWKSI
ncbi:biotin-independent malonate decarboxylase subunit beta [Clostridium sp. JNZ X4-2]